MNRVELVGRLTRDPEARTSSSGMTITRFTIAVDRPVRQGNDQSNGQNSQADFIGCVAFGRQAETIAKYMAKGRQMAVEGRIQTGSYDGQDGQRHYTTDVVVERAEFIGGRSDSGSQGNYSYQDQMDDQRPTVEENPTTSVADDPFKNFGDEVSLSDDDLPF